MKIRLMGTPDELSAAVARLGEVLDIVKASEPCPNKTGGLYRQYLVARLVRPATVQAERASQAKPDLARIRRVVRAIEAGTA